MFAGQDFHESLAMSDDSNPNTKCSICLSTFKHPKILPCLHTFCERPCLQRLLNSATSDAFQCPLCRLVIRVPLDGTRAFADNTRLQGRSFTRSGGNPTSRKERNCNANTRVNTRRESILETQFHTNDSQRPLLATHQTRYDTTQPLDESSREGPASCYRKLFMIVLVVQFLVGFTRAVAGMVFSIKIFDGWTDGKCIAIFQAVKGVLDILCACTAGCRRPVLFAIFTIGTIIVLFCASAFLLWKDWYSSSEENFVLVSRYYSIVDWCMVLFTIISLSKTTQFGLDNS